MNMGVRQREIFWGMKRISVREERRYFFFFGGSGNLIGMSFPMLCFVEFALQ